MLMLRFEIFLVRRFVGNGWNEYTGHIGWLAGWLTFVGFFD
jgi:hypothetical protein